MDPLSIISKTLPLAPVELEYSEQLQAIGGTPPYQWSVTSGSLPPGMALSTAGLLTAAIGAIPVDATGQYPFQIRARDSLTVDAFANYTFEVAPAAYERVPEFLLDPRLRELIGDLLIATVSRAKIERHFFRDLIGPTGVTFAHKDRDVEVPDWITPSNDVPLREALDDLLTSTLASIKTINLIAGDTNGDFDIVAGTGLSATPQPNGLRLDVELQVVGIQVSNVEADVSPGASQSLPVSGHPDVAEVWMRDEFDSSWNRLSEMSERLVKKVNPSDPAASWATANASGSNVAGTAPYFFTCHYDPAGPNLVLSKYNGESMAFIESATLALSGAIDGEPLVMVNRVAPYEPIIACVEGSPRTLIYAEYPDPDDLTTAPRTSTFDATDLDTSAVDFLPNEVSGYDSNAKQIFGTIVDDGGGGWDAVLALKIAVAPSGVGDHNAVLLRIPIGATPPVISHAASFGALNTDTLDVVFDGAGTPNSVYLLNATGRWTNSGAGTLVLWKIPYAGWAAAPVPPPVGLLPLPPTTWSQLVAAPPIDGMEVPKAILAMDVDAANKDAINVIYVEDAFHGNANLVTPIGPPLHTPSLAYARFDDVSNALGPTSQGGLILEQQDMAAVDATADGRFGRWWNGGDATSAWAYFINAQRVPGRLFAGSVFFDSAGMKTHLENTFNLSTPTAALSDPEIVRPAHTTYGVSTFIREARATALLGSDTAQAVLALDSPAKPNPFRTYYDGSTNFIFKNESPFEWHVKVEALVNDVGGLPPNMAVACWQLAQGLQDYWNTNGFYPSASSSPPGPGGAQGTVWDETETGTILTTGKVFYPTHYSILPGTWDLVGGSVAGAYYFSIGAAGTSIDQWLVFRYVAMPTVITDAEAVIAIVLTAGPLPTPGVYTLSEIATAMSQPSWVTNYSGSPFSSYEYRCFVNAAGTGYYHGWFSQNYIHNAQVYGPGAPGVEPNIPFVEKFTQVGNATSGVPTVFTISRYCRYAEVFVNGISYWQGDDWEFGTTTNKISFLNNLLPGYTLNDGDRVIIKYIV